jgi:hypothetical protein
MLQKTKGTAPIDRIKIMKISFVPFLVGLSDGKNYSRMKRLALTKGI